MSSFVVQPWETAATYYTDSPKHLYKKALDAHRRGEDAWGVMSTGEKAGVALVLNRADWLKEMGYSIPDAIDRAGDQWVLAMPRIAYLIANETELGS